VLRNNYAQTLAITLAERRGPEDIGFARRLMQSLESRGLLDRAVEALPDDASLAERARSGEGLTRPEIAVLLAYSKLALNADLLASGVPDDPYLSRDLDDYFPTEMRQRFLGAIETHRLRREIIATQLGNAMINRGGPTLIVRIADQTGAEVPAVAAAFAAVSNGFALGELNGSVDALDNLVPGGLQNELYAAIQELLLSRMVWFLRNVDLSVGLDAVVERFRPGIEAVRAWLATGAGCSAAARAARAAELAAAGVPEPLAETIAGLPALAAAPDAVLVAEEAAIPLGEAAALLFAAGEFFQVDRIVAAARTMPIGDHFERLAVDRAIDQLAASQRAFAIDAAAVGSVEEWARRRPESARFRNAAGEIAAAGGFTLARLTVVTSLLGDLARRR
jgi:glutamate dehydrogenase